MELHCELCGETVAHLQYTDDGAYFACEVCWSQYDAGSLGLCPDCGTPLENWGAASDGNGDIYDEIGCPLCEDVKEKHFVVPFRESE